jgi:hypothetical protein
MRYYPIYVLFFISFHLSAQLAQVPLLANANELVKAEGEVKLISEEEGVFTVKKRITILNESSNANLFYVYYDSDNKILDLDAKITDTRGNDIRKVKKSEIRDEAAVDGYSIYIDSRVRYIELNHSDYPYVLEFSYTQRLKGIDYAAFPNWQFQDRMSSSVTSSVYTIKVPSSLDIQYQAYNIDLSPSIQEEEDFTTYTWRTENIPAIRSESFAPPMHRILPMLRVSPSRFKIDDYSGSMSSWEAYGTFLGKLWSGKDVIPSELGEEVLSLTKDAVSTKEKISLLYQFMQENKRYVSVQLGIGGWQPFDASYVEERGYGDCKALSNYMKSMLSVVGVESYPVIIAAGRDEVYEIEDDFVDPAFNHAVLYVPEEDMWLECTSRNSPAGYLGSYCNDRKVLLITPEGGQLKRTPKFSTTENITTEKVQIKLSADGAATLEYQAEMKGFPHEKWRNAAFYSSQEELENRIREKGRLPSLSLGEVKTEYSSQSPQATLQFDAIVSRYASRAGKRLFVPLNLVCPQTDAPDQVEERQFPVVTTYGYTEESSTQFLLPDGYLVESLPKAVVLNTPYGKYQMTVSYENSKVSYSRKLEVYDAEHPASAYEDFRYFYLAIVKADASKMVLLAE